MSPFPPLSSYPLRNWMPICIDWTVIWPLVHGSLSIPPDLRCWLKRFSSGLFGVWTKPRFITSVLSFKKRYTLSFGINNIYYIWIDSQDFKIDLIKISLIRFTLLYKLNWYQILVFLIFNVIYTVKYILKCIHFNEFLIIKSVNNFLIIT